MTTKERILKHPAVESLQYEAENGWWAYLRKGWIDGEAMTHAIREDTLTQVLAKLKFVHKES